MGFQRLPKATPDVRLKDASEGFLGVAPAHAAPHLCERKIAPGLGGLGVEDLEDPFPPPPLWWTRLIFINQLQGIGLKRNKLRAVVHPPSRLTF